MKRREFMTGLGAVAAPMLAPGAAHAQQGTRVIGLLMGVEPTIPERTTVFIQALAEAGFVEGRTLTIERRSAEGRYERLAGLAADLVRRQVAVIAANQPPAALAAKAATKTIPIVFVLGSDPVRDGLVDGLSRPGGNVTGVTFFSNLLTAKRIELLRDVLPRIDVVGLLLNPKNVNAKLELDETRAAAQTLGLRLAVVQASTPAEIDAAFGELARQNIAGLVLAGDAVLTTQRDQIVALALRHRIASCHPNTESVRAGGLASYAANRADADHQFGLYIGRVLKGESPADLPVVQPTKFETVINLKTAKSLGLTVPPTLLARADEVIE